MILFELIWDKHKHWVGLFAHDAAPIADLLAAALNSQELHALPCMAVANESIPLPEPIMTATRDDAGIILPSGGRLYFNIEASSALSQLTQLDAACGTWYTEACSAPTGMNPAKPVLLELLSLIVSDAETKQLETVLAKAPQLMLNLLKLVNSVGMGNTSQASSIRQAITLLGRRQLQRWLQLLLYAEQYGSDTSTPPILIAAALRGKRMALWAEHGWLSGVDTDEAFLCGMLSLLDRLFGEPLEKLLAPLPLEEKLKAALLRHEGVLGQALNQLSAMEAGDLNNPILAPLLSKNATWLNSEIKAITWVHRLVNESF